MRLSLAMSKTNKFNSSGINLLRRVKRVGFTNCQQQVFSSLASPDPALRKAAGHALINAGSQSMYGIVAKGGFEYLKTNDDVNRILTAMRDDLDRGSCEIGFETYWVIAQRPSEV
jgi:hypothetical protein